MPAKVIDFSLTEMGFEAQRNRKCTCKESRLQPTWRHRGAPHRLRPGQSSFDQNPERQLESAFPNPGEQKGLSPTRHRASDTASVPQLEALLSFVREGELTVVVHSMDRLARNLDDLRRLVQKLTQRGVRIEFLKEGLVFTGEDSPMANLMLSVMGPSLSSSAP